LVGAIGLVLLAPATIAIQQLPEKGIKNENEEDRRPDPYRSIQLIRKEMAALFPASGGDGSFPGQRQDHAVLPSSSSSQAQGKKAEVATAATFFVLDSGTKIACTAVVQNEGSDQTRFAGWDDRQQMPVVSVLTLDKAAAFAGTWSLPVVADDLKRLGARTTFEIVGRSLTLGLTWIQATALAVPLALAELWAENPQTFLSELASKGSLDVEPTRLRAIVGE
jgi:hypothetical protein